MSTKKANIQPRKGSQKETDELYKLLNLETDTDRANILKLEELHQKACPPPLPATIRLDTVSEAEAKD